MDLLERIRLEHTRKNCLRIAAWVGNQQSRFDQLVHIFLKGDYSDAQRASWPLGEAVMANPALVKKHLKALVSNLDKTGQHEAIKRNTIRILQFIQIPPALQGQVMDRCFRYLTSPTEKPAVKAYSLTVIHQLSAQYPEIIHELREIIWQEWDHAPKAFRSRASAILKSLPD